MSTPSTPHFTNQTSKGSGEGGVIAIDGTELVSRAPVKKTDVSRLIDTIEAKRQKCLSQYNLRMLGGLVVGLVLGIYFAVFSGMKEALLMQAFLGTFLVIGIFTYMPIHAYRKAFKAEFMPALVASLGDFRYMPKRPINEKAYKRSGLVPPRYNIYMEDYIGGKVGSTQVELAETVISNPARPKPKHVHDKRVKGLPVSRGMSMLIIRPTSFKGHSIFTSKRGTKLEKEAQIKQPLTGIQLESNHTWLDIYTTQNTEAHSLARAEILDTIRKMSINMFNAPIEVSFYDKYVAFMMPYTNNMFEARAITKPAFSNEDIPTLEQHILLTRKLIEQLEHIA